MRRLAVLLVLVAGCAAPRVATGPSGDGLRPLWSAWAAGRTPVVSPDACRDAFGTYLVDFGVRGLACTTDALAPVGAAVAASGRPVFTSGPHAPGPDGLGLNLASRQFGHYSPAFVQWAVANGIPGEGRPAVRMATQPVYDAKLQRLARLFWLVRRGLAAEGYPERAPLGPVKDYVRYLRGGPLGAGANDPYPGFSMMAFNDRSRPVPLALGLREGDLDWYAALYEANTATGFWLRRAEDGTEPLFRDGLRRLLATYDAAWLAAHA